MELSVESVSVRDDEDAVVAVVVDVVVVVVVVVVAVVSGSQSDSSEPPSKHESTSSQVEFFQMQSCVPEHQKPSTAEALPSFLFPEATTPSSTPASEPTTASFTASKAGRNPSESRFARLDGNFPLSGKNPVLRISSSSSSSATPSASSSSSSSLFPRQLSLVSPRLCAVNCKVTFSMGL